MPNETIDDSGNLDFMALALLTVLIRHRDGWEITLAEVGAKYGYGRDAMANAMGLLQAARYVVKVRIMAVAGNQWSTEMYVFDTPATDTEVDALLSEVERDVEVRRAEVIPATGAAVAHARKRREKLQPKRRQGPSVAVPRVSEFPHSGATRGNSASPQVDPDCGVPRQSGDPTPSKKTVEEKTREKTDAPSARSAGDGRRPSAGSSAREAEGGSAASSKNQPAPPPQETPAPARKPKEKRPGHSREQLQRATEVCDLFPALLGVRLVPALTDAILEALAGDAPGADRTVAQLGARIERRWVLHRYAEKFHAGTLTSPLGAAIAMVRPLKAGDRYGCADPRCEDGVSIDTGEDCQACAERSTDHAAARRAAADTTLPRTEEPRGDVPQPRAKAAAWWECGACSAPGKGHAPEDGLCRECRAPAPGESIIGRRAAAAPF